jgi:secreted PhoX family phosphatase
VGYSGDGRAHRQRRSEGQRFYAGAAFGSPDGLSFDHQGVLWIQTDVSSSTINKKAYEGMGNNQMVATIPGTNEYRRFLTGPRGCEITGIAFTPDNRTLFINIQHPGEGGDDITDPANPRAVSTGQTPTRTDARVPQRW